ncbi:MAG: sialidase family protein [Chitinophagaceae bacterium]
MPIYNKKLLFFITIIFLITTACNKKVVTSPVILPESNFTLLQKDHIPESDNYVRGGILLNQENNPRFMERQWQGTPSIGRDRNKVLYAGWISGGDWIIGLHGEGIHNYVTVSVSIDDGKTWLHNKLIIYVEPTDSTRLKDVSFFNDKFGNLYMVWAKHVQTQNTKEWSIVWYSKIELVGANIRYSPPRKIAEGSMLNKPFYSETRNKIYFPIARWYEGDPVKHQPFIYEGRYDTAFNHLVDFKNVGFIPMDRPLRTIYEHMIVELKDSSFLGMSRTTDGIYFSKSKDGITWDNAQKFTGIGQTTPSRFHLSKLNSGRLLLIANNSNMRRNLRAFLSEDDGKTWPYVLTLDARFWTTYPDVVEGENGDLKIVYDFERWPSGTVYYLNINERDILRGTTSKFNRVIISTLK